MKRLARQHGVYGDVLDAAWTFAQQGHAFDPLSREMLCAVAEQAVEHWKEPDSGVWELPDEHHDTISKIACWGALDKALQLAEQGHLPDSRRRAWARTRYRIATWVDAHCWSDTLQAYTVRRWFAWTDTKLRRTRSTNCSTRCKTNLACCPR